MSADVRIVRGSDFLTSVGGSAGAARGDVMFRVGAHIQVDIDTCGHVRIMESGRVLATSPAPTVPGGALYLSVSGRKLEVFDSVGRVVVGFDGGVSDESS